MIRLALLTILLVLHTCVFAAEKITVILDWFPNPNQAPLFIAQYKNFFKDENLEVNLISPSNPADPPKLVAANHANLGLTYQPQFMGQVDQGLPLVRVGTLIDTPLECLVVLKNNGIETIADLKNKVIGSSSSSFNHIMLETMLKKHHLSLTDVKRVNVQFDLTQALIAKKIDAATGMSRNYEPVQINHLGYPTLTFFPEDYGIPKYSELIIIANKNKIHDDKIKRFMVALSKATDYLKKHPEESWKTFATHQPASNNTLTKKLWFDTLKYFTNNPNTFNATEWEHLQKFMYENKLINKIRPIEFYTIDLSKEPKL